MILKPFIQYPPLVASRKAAFCRFDLHVLSAVSLRPAARRRQACKMGLRHEAEAARRCFPAKENGWTALSTLKAFRLFKTQSQLRAYPKILYQLGKDLHTCSLKLSCANLGILGHALSQAFLYVSQKTRFHAQRPQKLMQNAGKRIIAQCIA
jgi:hypothetical protein